MNKIALYAAMILTSGVVFAAEGGTAGAKEFVEQVPSRYAPEYTVRSAAMPVAVISEEKLTSVLELLKLFGSRVASDEERTDAQDALRLLGYKPKHLSEVGERRSFSRDEPVSAVLQHFNLSVDSRTCVENDGKSLNLDNKKPLGNILSYPAILVVTP